MIPDSTRVTVQLAGTKVKDEYAPELYRALNMGDAVTAAALAGLIEEQYRIMRYALTDAVKRTPLPKKEPPGC